MNKYKSYPFCKGEAQLKQFIDMYYVACKDCECTTRLANSVEEAIYLWNRRVSHE